MESLVSMDGMKGYSEELAKLGNINQRQVLQYFERCRELNERNSELYK